MADEEKTQTMKNEGDEPVGPRRPLMRSKYHRVLWGVAGGIGDHIGVSALLVRVAFIVVSLFGGAGILAYLVLAVALPEDDGTGRPVPDSVWARLGKVLLVCFLVAIGLGLAAILAFASAWATATGHGTVVAVIVVALGAGLVAAAFATSFRRRITPWLLTAALVLGIPAGAIAAADIDIDGSIGERTYTPSIPADIPADGYKLGTGQLIVDLRDLPWKPGQTVTASAHLGIGQMIVSAPRRVCVVGHATGKAGELVVAGQVSHGIDPDVSLGTAASDAPRLQLDADIQLGQMVVTDEDPQEVSRHDSRYEDHHEEQEDRQRQVCGR
jgi:phage shock protein PspC (stress-responsive transcriptional regulator)